MGRCWNGKCLWCQIQERWVLILARLVEGVSPSLKVLLPWAIKLIFWAKCSLRSCPVLIYIYFKLHCSVKHHPAARGSQTAGVLWNQNFRNVRWKCPCLLAHCFFLDLIGYWSVSILTMFFLPLYLIFLWNYTIASGTISPISITTGWISLKYGKVMIVNTKSTGNQFF